MEAFSSFFLFHFGLIHILHKYAKKKKENQ